MNEAGVRHYAALMGINLIGAVKHNGWIDASCPFAPWLHKSGRDRNPSFGIHVNENGYSAYKCWSCHTHGKFPNLAFTLGRYSENAEVQALGHEIERAEVLEAPDFIPDEWDEEEEDENETPHIVRFTEADIEHFPFAYNRKLSRDYLIERGIDWHTALRLNLRFDPSQDRVLFPCYDERGRLVGLSGRAVHSGAELKVRDYLGLPKRSILLGGHRVRSPAATCRAALYGWSAISSRVVVVEGLFDYARLAAFGVPNVVALLGSEVTEEKQALLEAWDMPIIWMTDNDTAGEILLLGPNVKRPYSDGGYSIVREYDKGILYRMYGVVPQLTVTYPDGVKDPGQLTLRQARRMLFGAELFIKERT